ncbi:sulfotransferase [Rhodanobacter sp. C05]|uniref:tetratricopeptide repeat-containing sulfotransferase family protein n=1 Tax=Rhodanobacter sp. C05 TaxID=1945855 RepID=UPI000985ACB0|nr:sulfotransferase [Rhodanobacter sp. C05]OOG43388.1 sulfotransferase [Rhodanobacter sp. C05]
MIDIASQYVMLATAFNARDWAAVREISTHLLPHMPHHGAAHYMTGVSFMELAQIAPALDHLWHAVHLEPTRAHYMAQLAKALSLAQRLGEARLCADRAMGLSPGDPVSLNTLGQVYTRVQAHQQATTAFRGAVALMPNDAAYRFNLGNALTADGQFAAAEMELETCIQLNPRYWAAYLARAQLRRWSPIENHIGALSELAKIHRNDLDAMSQLQMALAKECEDIGHHHEAFIHYTRGKTAGGVSRRYSSKTDEALFGAVMASVQSAQPIGTGFATAEPIFVIGMPRTGTTLLERVITSHPDAYSAGELQNFGMALKRLSGSRTRLMLDVDTISSATQLDWNMLGETYLRSTRPATGETKCFVDKLPHNFIYAGHIANALPGAKIICVRRHPVDTCLSNFRQVFSPESPYYDYSYNLLDTGRYYVLFDRLMAHWEKIFPGRIMEVHYESLIESQEATTRSVLSHCGLTWNDACLQFQQNPAPVATASAAQVREPIYRSALNRWRHYQTELAELQSLLIAESIDFER